MEYLIHFSDGRDAYLAHHGILGQKWGVRRYQNQDGTLTDEGKKKYLKRITSYRDDYKERAGEARKKVSEYNEKIKDVRTNRARSRTVLDYKKKQAEKHTKKEEYTDSEGFTVTRKKYDVLGDIEETFNKSREYGDYSNYVLSDLERLKKNEIADGREYSKKASSYNELIKNIDSASFEDAKKYLRWYSGLFA